MAPLNVNIVGRRRPGMTLAEHRHYIRRVHGERVLVYIGTEPESAPRRYVQNAVVDSVFRDTAPGSDPFALDRDFVTQVWFEDFGALERSRRTAYYDEHLKADEDRFADQASVVFLASHEREIIRRGRVPAGAWKRFVLIQRVPGVEQIAFAGAWARAAEHAGDVALRHVQNDVLGRPDAVAPADAIDEFWFDDEAAARTQLSVWAAMLHEQLVLPGLAVDGSLVALIAREDVLHAGAA